MVHHKPDSFCKETEDVQRHATTLIHSIKDKEYPDRSGSTEMTKTKTDGSEGTNQPLKVQSTSHGIYTVNNPQFELAQGRETRGNSLKLIKPRCRLNTRGSFLSERVVTT